MIIMNYNVEGKSHFFINYIIMVTIIFLCVSLLSLKRPKNIAETKKKTTISITSTTFFSVLEYRLMNFSKICHEHISRLFPRKRSFIENNH